MATLNELFPNAGPNMSQAQAYQYGWSRAPGIGFLSQIFQGVNDYLSQRRAIQAAQATAQAEAQKQLMLNQLKAGMLERQIFGEAADVVTGREREARIRELTPWAPRTQEEALWWLQQKQKYAVPRGGSYDPLKALSTLALIFSRMPDEPQPTGLPAWLGEEQVGITDPFAWSRIGLGQLIEEEINRQLGRRGVPSPTDPLLGGWGNEPTTGGMFNK